MRSVAQIKHAPTASIARSRTAGPTVLMGLEQPASHPCLPCTNVERIEENALSLYDKERLRPTHPLVYDEAHPTVSMIPQQTRWHRCMLCAGAKNQKKSPTVSQSRRHHPTHLSWMKGVTRCASIGRLRASLASRTDALWRAKEHARGRVE